MSKIKFSKLFLIFLLGILSLLQINCVKKEEKPVNEVKQVYIEAGKMPRVSVNMLPAEAVEMLDKIDKGGPFDYKKDGAVFGNFEKVLPQKSRGYYHEYTVETPGARNRGTRRIITGKQGEIYYTDDHYKTFKEVIR